MALNVFMFKQTPMIYILTKNINTEHLKNILDTEEGKKIPNELNLQMSSWILDTLRTFYLSGRQVEKNVSVSEQEKHQAANITTSNTNNLDWFV